MALFEWSNDLSVNVAEIDSQHRQLIGMINNLNEAMKQRKGKEALEKTLADLLDYAQKHFATEEGYFTRFAYPQAMAHKAKHSAFVEKVYDFKEEYEAGKLSLTLDVMNFLKDWLKGHIQGEDKKYGPFFNEKGLK
jgi:hemerythrin